MGPNNVTMRSLCVTLAITVIAGVWCASLFARDAGQDEDPLLVVKDGRYGFVDKHGNVVLAPIYYWANSFFDGVAETYICGKFVNIDRRGRVISSFLPPKGEFFSAEKKGKVGFINWKGQFTIPPIFDQVLPFSEGLAAVEVGNKWIFIDTSGRRVFSNQFDEAYYFIDGVANVKISGVRTIINKDGKIIHRGDYYMSRPAEGLIPIEHLDGDGKAGFIDHNGAIVIPFIYDFVLGFSEGLSAVGKDGKVGYIDKKGNVVIPFEFDQAEYFEKGLASARIGQNSGFIDKSGNFAFHLQFVSSAGFGYSDPARFWTEDQKFGYVDRSGKVVWGPTHEQPDHLPIMGLTKNDEKASCEGIPEKLKRKVQALPKFD